LNKLTYRGKNWFTVLYIHVNNTIFTRCFDPNNLDNYCAIFLTSNMEKLFTSLLNSRLNKLSDDIGLISGVQGREGEFRKWYLSINTGFMYITKA
jgi:hypothetical protein